jgi:hypothetical protein
VRPPHFVRGTAPRNGVHRGKDLRRALGLQLEGREEAIGVLVNEGQRGVLDFYSMADACYKTSISVNPSPDLLVNSRSFTRSS